MQSKQSLDHAYLILVSVVRKFELDGRCCIGALLKPAFLQAAGQGVNEHTLGFRRFGDFLRAAQASGHVLITKSSGKDLEVSLPAILPETNSQQEVLPLGVLGDESSLPVYVRADLWRAVNSSSQGWFYDVRRDLAVRSNLIRESSEIPSNFIPLPDTKYLLSKWLQDFIQLQDPHVQLSLKPLADKSYHQFIASLRRTPNVLWSWRRHHARQVIALMKTWAETNNVKPKDMSSSLRPLKESSIELAYPQPVENLTVSVRSDSDPTPDLLNSRLFRLIDELIDELARLRGLVEITSRRK